MSPLAAIIAIQMNNEGVKLLKKSQYGPAISLFRIALANVKEMIVLNDEDEAQSSTQDESAIRESSSGQSSYSTSSSGCTLSHTMSISSSVDMIALDPDDRSIIFCHPITLSKKCEGNSSKGAYNKFSFAILFNIALAYHLGGIECTKSKEAKLRKALRLYECASSMRKNVHLQITYTLAIVNNVGHIQESLGEQQKAQQSFQQLLSTLMCVMESGEENCRGEWDIFLHNITHIVLRNNAMAAAA
jgi:hypothetical protein